MSFIKKNPFLELLETPASEQSFIWFYGNISWSPVIMPGGREPLSQVDGQHLLHSGVGEEEVSLD